MLLPPLTPALWHNEGFLDLRNHSWERRENMGFDEVGLRTVLIEL